MECLCRGLGILRFESYPLRQAEWPVTNFAEKNLGLADGASTLGAKQKTSAHLLSLNGNDIPRPKKPQPQRGKVRLDRLFEEALMSALGH